MVSVSLYHFSRRNRSNETGESKVDGHHLQVFIKVGEISKHTRWIKLHILEIHGIKKSGFAKIEVDLIDGSSPVTDTDVLLFILNLPIAILWSDPSARIVTVLKDITIACRLVLARERVVEDSPV